MQQGDLKERPNNPDPSPRFYTAQKQPQFQANSTPNTTNTSSVRIPKKKVIKAATVKMLKQALIDQTSIDGQNQYSIVFQLLGRITSITSTAIYYALSFEDDTESSQDCPLLVGKQSQLSLTNPKLQFSSIQFEENLEEGQPYYRLWVRIVKSECFVDKFQMVKDYNLIFYHRLKVMTAKGIDSIKLTT